MATLVEIVTPTFFTSDSGVRYTNKFNLPIQLVRAIMKDRYTVEGETDSDYSVSRLIVPIQQLVLTQRYPDKIIIRDVMHYWKSFLGSVIHQIAEEGHQVESGAIVEQRLYMTVLGKVISGKFDCYHDMLLNDYKSTGVYKLQKQDYSDWETTVNLYAEFCRQHDLPINSLVITYFALDWKQYEAFKKNYPKSPMGTIDLPLWESSKAKSYIEDRVYKLERAKTLDDETLSTTYPCSNKDMWRNFKDWCVKRKDSDRATKTFEKEEDAIAYLEDESKKTGKVGPDTHEVAERYERRKRCLEWCDVAHLCPQFKRQNIEDGIKWIHPNKP